MIDAKIQEAARRVANHYMDSVQALGIVPPYRLALVLGDDQRPGGNAYLGWAARKLERGKNAVKSGVIAPPATETDE